MRAGLFWLNERQWACIARHLPTNLTGPERDDDRRIISGIIHMLQCGARWRDCPPEYGPYTEDSLLEQEFLDLAATCEEVGNEIEDRLPCRGCTTTRPGQLIKFRPSRTAPLDRWTN